MCRVLFEPKGQDSLRQPMYGALDLPWNSMPLTKWPLYPVALSGSSYFVLSDGSRALRLGTAQDHKRIHDDDLGPNTGGMGAFAPSPLVDLDLDARVMREIVCQNVRALQTLNKARVHSSWLAVSLEGFGRHSVAPANGLITIGDGSFNIIRPLFDLRRKIERFSIFRVFL